MTLAAEVQGRVIRISDNLLKGGEIHRDEVLLELDPLPFQAALDQAIADRQSASAALSLAAQLIKRTRDLIRQGFLSRQTLDERVAGRDQAQAALARAQAIESQRRIDLGRTTITAPFDGRVLQENVSIGDTVQPGRELARIFNDRELEVTISLTGKSMSLIDDPWKQTNNAGAPAVIRVNHGGGLYEWKARLDRIEAAIDSATRTFSLVVRPTEPGASGKPVNDAQQPGPPLVVGMYASASIAGRDLGHFYLLPRKSLRRDNTVWLATADETIAIVKAEILTELDDEVAVRLSLPDLEPLGVVISDLKIVTPGMRIRLKEPDDSPITPLASQTPIGPLKP